MENEITDLIPHAIDPVLFLTKEEMDTVLSEIERRATVEAGDVTTSAGRKGIASMAYKVARSKTYIDDALKRYIAAKKAEVKAHDAIRKHAIDFLDNLKDRVREPLNAWEAAEKARAEAEKLAEEFEKDHELALEMNAALDDRRRVERQAEELRQKQAELDRREAELKRAEREKQIREQAKAEADENALSEIRRFAEREAQAQMELEKTKADAAAAVKKAEEDKAAAVAEAERKGGRTVITEPPSEEELEEALRRKREEFVWDDEAEQAFRNRVYEEIVQAFAAHGIPPGIGKVVVGLIVAGRIDRVRIDFLGGW